MFDTIFGLPLHALVIHAVVVLIPLTAVAVVVMAFSATWRERLRLPVTLLLLIGAASTFVAKESGEQLQKRVTFPGNPAETQLIDHHVDIGGQAFIVVMIYAVVVLVWLYVDWRKPAGTAGLFRVLTVLAVIGAVAATGWIVWAGDAGARAVWEQVVQSTNGR